MNNEKTEKKIRKKNNLAFLVSSLAIIALTVCLAIVLLLRVGLKNNSKATVASETSKSVSDAANKNAKTSDNKEMISQLEEVQHYLETLESSLKESTSTINTLYKDKTEKSVENDVLARKIDEMSSKLGLTKKEVAELIASLENNEINDTSVILKNFVDVMKEVNSVRDTLNATVSSLSEQDSVNQAKMEELMKSLQSRLDKVGSDNKTDLNGINVDIKNRLDELSKDYGGRFDKIDSDLSKVFQSVSNGKTALTSAVADKQIFVPEGDVTFGTLSELIRHIGSDVSNLDEGKVLEGTIAFDGLQNKYVIGNIRNNGEQEKFAPAGIESKTYLSGYYPNDWTVDTSDAYKQGYADGYAEKQDEASIEYHYHVHEGTPGEIGGCYGEERYITGYEQMEYQVTGHLQQVGYPDGSVYGVCDVCGGTGTWEGVNSEHCSQTRYIDNPNKPIYGTRIGLICGKTEETLEYATIVFPN